MGIPPFGQDLGMTIQLITAISIGLASLYWAFVMLPEEEGEGLRDLLGGAAFLLDDAEESEEPAS